MSQLNSSHLDLTLPSPHSLIDWPPLTRPLLVKRDDCIHKNLSGNKWRKLKYPLHHAPSLQRNTIVSMGGAWSNHLHALAFAGKAMDLNTVGLIRGESEQPLTATLKDCQRWGMQLQFVDRQTFRQLRQLTDWQPAAVVERLTGSAAVRADDYQHWLTKGYWLSEGGAGELALKGVAEIIDELPCHLDQLWLACGTATTLQGLVMAARQRKRKLTIIGVAAFNKAHYLQTDLQGKLGGRMDDWQLIVDERVGQFAQLPAEIAQFAVDWEARTQLQLDPVYTAKALWCLHQHLLNDELLREKNIAFLHTGGLQGRRGYEQFPS